jgi:hypothetical protein
MSWLFSQALAEAYLEVSSLDGEQSAPSNGIHTPLAYCAPDKTTAFSRLSRFGTTFKPLMEIRGEALLMLYLEDFLAKTSALPEKEQELTEPDQECGPTWLASWAKFDPVSCSWKTVQQSLLEDSDECSVTWPQSGMTVNGQCLARPMLGLLTNVTDFGLWPTPTVCGNYNRKGASSTSGDGLATAVKKWPTPTAHNAKETNAPSEANRNTPTLANQAGGSLNPTWVEWLMGWPLGWTDLKPLETVKFQRWQQQHGGC